MINRALASLWILGLTLCASSAQASGILFVGADTEEFNSLPTDRIGRFETGGVAGTDIVGSSIIVTPYYVNGMADGGGFLYAGQPLNSQVITIGYDGTFLGNLGGGAPSDCCFEDMAFDPSEDVLYHAKYSDRIEALDPLTGVVLDTFLQTDVVGMAHVGGTIWISKWSGQSVGTWDPATNIYTPVFFTPNFAGGLAWDPFDGVMWVGERGGTVTPYSLTGAVLGPSFQPFGAIPDTIDGLVFLGEATPGVPEPGSFALLAAGLVGLGLLRRRTR